MKRISFALPTICLAIFAAFATHGWTQDDAPRERGATERKVAAEEDALRQKPPAVRDIPGGDEARGRNLGRLSPVPPAPGSSGLGPRNINRDGHVPMRARTVSKTVNEIIYQPIDAEEFTEMMAFREARMALKDAKDEAARKTAAEAIRQHLEKQFDRDLSQREQELAAVEERVRQLRQQVEKRSRSKDEIVTLRLKTMLNNADGLGFPGDDDLQDPSGLVPGPVRSLGVRTTDFYEPPIRGRGNVLDPNSINRDDTPQPYKRDQPASNNPGEGRNNNKEGRAEPR